MARLVFHIPSLGGGGAERVWVLLANEMARRGHAVTLLVWNGEGPNAAHRSPAVDLVDFAMPIRNEGFGKPATLRGLVRMAAWLRRHRPDAVFSGPEFANLVTALSLLVTANPARFFPSFHAAADLKADRAGSTLARGVVGMMGRRATNLVAVSQGIADDLRTARLGDGKVVVINNPLPPPVTATTPPQPWEAALAAARRANIPVIATAGRLSPVKDHRTLVEAFALLRQHRPARLVIFGEGPLQAQLEAQIARLGLETDVLLPGFVAPQLCYRHADLFALSSLSEGFGNVLVEAMAAGVPVVTTDCPHGPRDILDGGRLGRLVPVGDAPALAIAMAAMLDAPTPRDALLARASQFAIGPIGDRYEALLSA